MKCIRCGRSEKIERHHIKQRVHGGDDEDDNLENRCQPCHKFEHTLRALTWSLEYEKQIRGQKDRLIVLQRRIDVLEELNTPELIRSRGTYVSYWINSQTHHLPRGIPTKNDLEVERIIQSAFKELAQESDIEL